MSGLKLPRMGFGTWQLPGAACTKGVLKALEVGYRHIDTAQIYENEAEVGAAIAEKTVDRKDIVLATKIWNANLSPKQVKVSFEQSLQKLQTAYVDLLYVHWPAPPYDAKATLQAFADLVDAGKVKFIGVSNFGPKLCDEAIKQSPKPIAANQIETHPLLQQKAMREYLKNHQIAYVAYSPLARGHLTKVPELIQVATRHRVSVSQVSLAWLMHHGFVPIPKSTSEKHLRENWAAQELRLTPEDIAQIDGIPAEKRFIDPHFPRQFE